MLIKKIILILYCPVILISCKNNNPTNTKEENKASLNTPATTNIPGTHILMAQPPGFTPSTGAMKGFIKDEETTFISVSEFKGRSFNIEIATHSPERLKEQGNTIFLETKTKVGEYEARLMRIGDSETSTVWQLIFGDDSLSVMIMGIYPSGDEISGKQIEKAIETVQFDKDLKVDEKVGIKYTINPNESNYKYLKMEGILAFYSLNGNADIKSGATPYLVVSQIARQNGSPQSFVETSLEAVLRNGFTNPVIKSKGFLTVNNNSAYEMEAACKLKGRSVTVYIAVVVKDNTAVMIQGLAKNNIEETLTGFKQFTDAIE